MVSTKIIAVYFENCTKLVHSAGQIIVIECYGRLHVLSYHCAFNDARPVHLCSSLVVPSLTQCVIICNNFSPVSVNFFTY